MRSLRYLTAEGFKNVWDNRLMSLASIGVLISCMALIGSAMLVTFNVDKAMASIEKENVVMVHLNDYNSVKYDEAYIDNSAPESSSSAVSSAESESDSVGGSAATNMELGSEISSTASDSSNKEIAHNSVPADAYKVHDQFEAQLVCDEIANLGNVVSAELLTPEQMLERLENTVDEDYAKYIEQFASEGENPMSYAVKVTLEDLSRFDTSIKQIENIEGVHRMASHREIAQKITSLKNAIEMASYIIIGVLMVIALVIVCNTIRVTMFNRKLEISIMKAVGATDAFIRFPFVVEGVVIGLISALATTGLLYVGYEAVLNAMGIPVEEAVAYSAHVLEFIGIFAAVGVISGLIGSVFMINRYLRKEGSEFSAMS